MIPDDPPATAADLAELAELREKTAALVEQMDALLAVGSLSNAVADNLYEELGVRPGIGKRVLLGNTIPPDDQYIYSTFLTEFENIEETVRGFEKRVNAPAPQAAGPRAVGSRYRI